MDDASGVPGLVVCVARFRRPLVEWSYSDVDCAYAVARTQRTSHCGSRGFTDATRVAALADDVDPAHPGHPVELPSLCERDPQLVWQWHCRDPRLALEPDGITHRRGSVPECPGCPVVPLATS